jgi:20S proteasome alpha/beta subunit
VEAAFEAASKGGTVVAIKGSESVVILSYTPSVFGENTLKSRNKKVRKLCESICFCASGIAADVSYLSNSIFQDVLNHQYAFGSDPGIFRLAKAAAGMLHVRTLKSYRPLGLKAIFCGWGSDGKVNVIEVDPLGNIHNCKISCIGSCFNIMLRSPLFYNVY